MDLFVSILLSFWSVSILESFIAISFSLTAFNVCERCLLVQVLVLVTVGTILVGSKVSEFFFPTIFSLFDLFSLFFISYL